MEADGQRSRNSSRNRSATLVTSSSQRGGSVQQLASLYGQRTAEVNAEARRASFQDEGGRHSVGQPIMGWLVKQGEKVKSWKKRYFALVGDTLRWYEHEAAHRA